MGTVHGAPFGVVAGGGCLEDGAWYSPQFFGGRVDVGGWKTYRPAGRARRSRIAHSRVGWGHGAVVRHEVIAR